MISANNGSTLTTYTYDYRNRLTGVTQGGTAIATYAYDALDRRIGIKDNGTQTWTVYNGSNADATPYADFNGSGTLTERYLDGPGVVNGAVVDEILARTSSGGTTAWYLPDKLGSVRDIVSPTGTELDHVVYDSFGTVLTETNATNGDRFKYAGMEFDSAIGQYYDRARYYDSVTGRFMGQDPMGFGAGYMNLYSYVGNDPVDEMDYSGLEPGPQRTGSPQPGAGQQRQTAEPQQVAPGMEGIPGMPKTQVDPFEPNYEFPTHAAPRRVPKGNQGIARPGATPPQGSSIQGRAQPAGSPAPPPNIKTDMENVYKWNHAARRPLNRTNDIKAAETRLNAERAGIIQKRSELRQEMDRAFNDIVNAVTQEQIDAANARYVKLQNEFVTRGTRLVAIQKALKRPQPTGP